MSRILCFVCKTEMVLKKTSIKAGWGKYKLIIEGVEAYICPKCGEELYTSDEVGMMQNLGKNLSSLIDTARPELLNVSETADLLRISSQSVYNMIKDGRLKAVKAGREWRFLRKEIEDALKSDDKSEPAGN
jgi:excisionase family DNA binding protein/YgiT-type zinc finger domain-containing protein